MPTQIDHRTRASSVASRIQIVRGPDGIEAWLLEDHSLPLVSLTFGFRGGAALDRDGKAGTARMLGGLLTDGAGSLNGEAFQLALAEDAIEMAFGIERDRLVGSVTTMADKAPEAFALVGTALREPHFAPEEIDRRRYAYRAQLRGQQSRPGYLANEAFWQRGFQGHPYARSFGGRPDELDAIGRDDIVSLHRDLVTRSRLRVAVVGAIDATALAAALDQAFGGLPDAEAAPIARTALQGVGEEIAQVVDNPQTEIFLGRPAIGIHDPDFAAAFVMNHCLGGHPITSRLPLELRERRGLCYAIGSGLDVAEGVASLLIMASTPNEHAREVVRLIHAETERLARHGLDDAAIETARSFLIGSQAMEMDTSRSAARMLLSLQFNGRSLTWLDERRAQLSAITPADVARVIDRVIGDGSLLVSIAGGSA